MSRILICDTRLGGVTTYRLARPTERLVWLPDEVRKCVGFVGYRVQSGIRPAGSGFFVIVPSARVPDAAFSYFVTARHVIMGITTKSTDRTPLLRLNKTDGSYAWIETDLDAWLYHPTDHFADVAVIPFGDAVPNGWDYAHIPRDGILTSDEFEESGIGIGDEVAIVGLFSMHYGRQRNIPIVRIGNIAAMPEESVQAKIFDTIAYIDAFLVEARSIGGLSGSPVFANRGQIRVVNGQLSYWKTPQLFLIGLIHGHWESQLTTQDVAADNNHELRMFNMGVAVTVPATKILETLNHPELVARRLAWEEQKIAESIPTPDHSI